MSLNQILTKEDLEIIENVISSFEIIEDMLSKSHSIECIKTRSQQLAFKHAIKKIRLYLINVQEKYKE